MQTTETSRAGVPADSAPAGARPAKPHDGLSFEELGRRYNFEVTSDHRPLFARLVIDECRSRRGPIRVLDVGCGRGIGRQKEHHHAIRPHVDEYWGIEPDEGVFDHVQRALMETATLPEDAFDVVYAYNVMEHVDDPANFMRAVRRCLKPGGAFLFATPNSGHYFTITARFLHRIKLDEFVLSIVQRGVKDDYHYPVRYRFNSERAVNRYAQEAGFLPPQYAYVEHEGPRGYLKGPLRPIYEVLRAKRRIVRNPRTLICMLGRITKAA